MIKVQQIIFEGKRVHFLSQCHTKRKMGELLVLPPFEMTTTKTLRGVISIIRAKWGRVRENFLPIVGHFVWRSWGSSSDILGFRQSFYTENGRQIWLLCWTFCLTTQELLVRHFQNSSDMSDVTDGFREAWWGMVIIADTANPNAALCINKQPNDYLSRIPPDL